MSAIEAFQRIETVEVLNSDDVNACAWLETNAPKGPPQWYSEDKKHQVVSWSLSRRPSKSARLTAARYGTHLQSLRRLFLTGTKTERLGVLSNSAVGPYSDRFDSRQYFLSDNLALEILKEPQSREFQVFIGNPYLNREWLANVLENWDEDSDLSDLSLITLVDLLSSSRVITERYDDLYMDGYAEYSHNRLNFQLADLLQTVPVTARWANSLASLVQRLYLPYVPEFDTNLLDRWQNPEEENNKYFDPFENLRKLIVKYIITRDHRSDLKGTLSFDHPDPAVRNGLYSTLRPYDFFKGARLDDNFEYPSFKYLGEYELDSQQELVVKVCKDCFERDKNEFVRSILENEHFWRSERERNLLNTLCWDVAEDPRSDMDLPNLYRAFEARHQKENPGWFGDKHFTAEFPEDMPIEPRLDQIREEISQLRLELTNLKGEESLDETSQKLDVSLATIQEQLREIDESIDRRLAMTSVELNSRLQGVKTVMWIVFGALLVSVYLHYL
ncbi:MAG: hypothetical protein JJ921_02140 [Pseudomonadales bacterium]|nr:hypothetical protein [Pseudomonadales bacterium]MBO7005043.1 hypothetical protein [Pseudomonadales bacterium]